MDLRNERKDWLGLLARSAAPQVATLFASLKGVPQHHFLRRAEIGGVMTQGRMGATGAAFNLGEMTVTRCAVQLADETVGHGYVQGRDKTHAAQAALVDAMMQTAAADHVYEALLLPLATSAQAAKAARAAKAAATKVDFFTLVRGED